MKHTLTVLAVCLFISSCSLVYSPNVNLPAAPPRKGDFQVQANIASLPETNPGPFTPLVQPGIDVFARYSFTGRLSVQGKWWKDLDARRGGISVNTLIVLSHPEAGVKFGIMPGISGLYGIKDDSRPRLFRATALSVPLVAWFKTGGQIGLYGAITPVYGNYNFEKAYNSAFQFRLRHGMAVYAHAGATYRLYKSLSLNAELVAGYQYNLFDAKGNLVIAPNGGLSWTF